MRMTIRSRGRRGKYGAIKTEFDGRRFDSKGEAARAAELRVWERAGIIADLVYQPHVELEPGIHYKPDFRYTERGRLVHEDFKGVTTARFRLICHLWALHGPSVLRITRRHGRGFVVAKEILPR